MIAAAKARLCPNEEQKVLLEEHFGSFRFVYNYFLSKVTGITCHIRARRSAHRAILIRRTRSSSSRKSNPGYTGWISNHCGCPCAFPTVRSRTSFTRMLGPRVQEEGWERLFRYATARKVRGKQNMLPKVLW